jgi:hypothetical protein
MCFLKDTVQLNKWPKFNFQTILLLIKSGPPTGDSLLVRTVTAMVILTKTISYKEVSLLPLCTNYLYAKAHWVWSSLGQGCQQLITDVRLSGL